ncbi:hypothetical protein E5288_WYG000999 [Bos mutus]|uniref:Uncharacterized protein n=1 Tax=Bos mutus TaxID=72004 RepID=A0A6B0RZC3_9CETA|nr:hypothetical protein [Bos mutus]
MTGLFLWLPRRPQTRKALGLRSQRLSDPSTALHDVMRDDRTKAVSPKAYFHYWKPKTPKRTFRPYLISLSTLGIANSNLPSTPFIALMNIHEVSLDRKHWKNLFQQPHLSPLGSVEMLALLQLFQSETPDAGLLSDLRLCWGPDPASLCTSTGLQRPADWKAICQALRKADGKLESSE